MECDVLIIGAGPVGLMLAHELARRGICHRIIETKTARERYCKALGVSPRTLEIFDHMGVLDDALRLGFFFESQTVLANGEVIREGAGQNDANPYGYFALAQPDCEEILEAHGKRFGVSIERGLTLNSLEQDADGVTATFEDGRAVRCRYLVGCDGAHSTVRKRLGVSFEGERFDRTFLLGDVVLDWARPHRQTCQMMTFEGEQLTNIFTFIPNPTGPHRYRVSTSIASDAECDEHPSLEFLADLLKPVLPAGTTVSDLRWSSRYNISHRIAGSYQQGRVFLAGDAAHIHPPIGGLGMNTGLQDAYNLGWKLAAVCQGKLASSLLESYHAERHPVGSKVVEITGARMQRSMQGDKTARAQEPPDFDSQLRIRYESGTLVGGESLAGFPRPGDRLPTVAGLKRPHITGHLRLAELFRNGYFQLFCCQVDWEAFNATALGHLADEVRCWTVVTELPDHAQGFFLDTEQGWERTVGTGAVLVRPDGVIGWRGHDVAQFEQWLAKFSLEVK